MKRLLIAAGIVLIGLGPGCGRSTTSPTSVVTPAGAPPAPPPAPLNLHGYVSDTAFRPMGGVRVEVVNGPDAGKELFSDEKGVFSYTGMFPGGVSMRATKEGYFDATSSVFPSTTSANAWVSFLLAPLAPPVDMAGNYTLTIAVDSACTGFPDEVRTRSYEARLTRRTVGNLPANTRFDGTVSGAQFAPYSSAFFFGVAGDYVTLSTEGEGPSIVEHLGDNRYISYLGEAGASVATPGPGTLSASFNGSIEYCELKSPIGLYYDCSDALAAVKQQCTSPNSQLTLTPR